MGEPLKGTVRHTLSKMDPHPIQWITRKCILEPNDKDARKHWHTSASDIQRLMQFQYYRAITRYPERRRELTYALNCRPSGFKTAPYTQACKLRRVCPWCFSRGLLSVYDALLEPDAKIQNLHSLLLWKRRLTPGINLPFFRPDRGPHAWCKALVTAQIVVPFYHQPSDAIMMEHIGFQIIPKDIDYAKLLKRNTVHPELNCIQLKSATPSTIVKAFGVCLSFNWTDLYLKANLDRFIELLDGYKNQRMVRVSRYKPKGENCGD